MGLDLATFVAEPTKAPDVLVNDFVDFLKRKGASLSAEEARDVETILLSTETARVRNAAALALVDAHYPGLETVINQLLKLPAIAPASGTLIYCLMESGARVAAGAISNIVRNGSYEARSELLILMSDGMVSADHDDELNALQSELDSITSSVDEEAAEVAALALQDLEAIRRT